MNLAPLHVIALWPPASERLELAEGWRPWRAYAAVHLWDGLAAGALRRGA